MKVFISWSGERSKYVARFLYKWVGSVNHFVEPWLSEEMPKGVRWSPEMAKALDETKFGIFCVTPENQSEPWLNFEAGALSKTVNEKSYVCPYLIDLKSTDVVGPLKEFQLTKTDQEDTFRLICSMNQALGDQALSEGRIKASFDKWWPDLEKALKEIPSSEKAVPKARETKDLQEETLEIVRRIDSSLNNLRREARPWAVLSGLSPLPARPHGRRNVRSLPGKHGTSYCAILRHVRSERFLAGAERRWRDKGQEVNRLCFGLRSPATIRTKFNSCSDTP